VHPGRGLIGPEEYALAPRTTFAGEMLRRILGGQ
jgi:hypothetical protein